MAIFLGYETGIQLWRQPEVWSHVSFSSGGTFDVVPEEDDAPVWALDACSSSFWRDVLQGLDHPLDVVASSARRRGRAGGVRWHVRSQPLPRRSGLRLDEGIYLASPDLCLLQMAESLPLVRLVELIDEFCGTYQISSARVDATGRGEVLATRPPLTSTSLLGDYLAASEGVRGVKGARMALGYAVDGSASPKETQAEMLACLPHHLGGHMLRKAEMNKRFDVPLGLRASGVSSFYRCDLCWPVLRANALFHHVALEYQSSEFHAGTKELADDSRRRNVLEALGVHEITLTAAELYDPSQFERVVKMVAQQTGQRTNPAGPDFPSKRDELRGTLLSADKS